MEITDFCKSLDFMKLGQAINHNNWRAASSVLQRMQKQYEETGRICSGGVCSICANAFSTGISWRRRMRWQG